MGHDKISSAEDEGGVPPPLDALLENHGVYTIVWVFFYWGLVETAGRSSGGRASITTWLEATHSFAETILTNYSYCTLFPCVVYTVVDDIPLSHEQLGTERAMNESFFLDSGVFLLNALFFSTTLHHHHHEVSFRSFIHSFISFIPNWCRRILLFADTTRRLAKGVCMYAMCFLLCLVWTSCYLPT